MERPNAAQALGDKVHTQTNKSGRVHSVRRLPNTSWALEEYSASRPDTRALFPGSIAQSSTVNDGVSDKSRMSKTNERRVSVSCCSGLSIGIVFREWLHVPILTFPVRDLGTGWANF